MKRPVITLLLLFQTIIPADVLTVKVVSCTDGNTTKIIEF